MTGRRHWTRFAAWTACTTRNPNLTQTLLGLAATLRCSLHVEGGKAPNGAEGFADVHRHPVKPTARSAVEALLPLLASKQVARDEARAFIPGKTPPPKLRRDAPLFASTRSGRRDVLLMEEPRDAILFRSPVPPQEVRAIGQGDDVVLPSSSGQTTDLPSAAP